MNNLMSEAYFSRKEFTLYYGVSQDPQLINSNFSNIAMLECKWGIRNEGRAGAEDNAGGKLVLSEEIVGKLVEAAFEFARAGLPLPVGVSRALDREVHRQCVGIIEVP